MQFEPTLIFGMRRSSITSESLTPLTNYTAFLNEGKTTTTGHEYYRAQSGSVKAHFVTTAHYVTTRAFRNKISAHFVTTRIL